MYVLVVLGVGVGSKDENTTKDVSILKMQFLKRRILKVIHEGCLNFKLESTCSKSTYTRRLAALKGQ